MARTKSARNVGGRWIAPRSGGYRPGGEFRVTEPSAPRAGEITAPKGPAGVVVRERKESK